MHGRSELRVWRGLWCAWGGRGPWLKREGLKILEEEYRRHRRRGRRWAGRLGGRCELLDDENVVNVHDPCLVAEDDGGVEGVALALRIKRYRSNALTPLGVRELARRGVPANKRSGD